MTPDGLQEIRRFRLEVKEGLVQNPQFEPIFRMHQKYIEDLLEYIENLHDQIYMLEESLRNSGIPT